MPEFVSGIAKEGEGIRLIKSLEEFRGCTLQIAGRRTGFNGISVCNGDIIRKIELKTVANSDDWFAINGLYGIQSLLFDPQYYLYFALIRQKKILIAPGKPFLQAQIPGYNVDVNDDMRKWIELTRGIGATSGLNIIPRVNFKLKLGIRALINQLENDQQTFEWQQCVDSIWHFTDAGSWHKAFPSADNEKLF